jgi:hypothetical protein
MDSVKGQDRPGKGKTKKRPGSIYRGAMNISKHFRHECCMGVGSQAHCTGNNKHGFSQGYKNKASGEHRNTEGLKRRRRSLLD